MSKAGFYYYYTGIYRKNNKYILNYKGYSYTSSSLSDVLFERDLIFETSGDIDLMVEYGSSISKGDLLPFPVERDLNYRKEVVIG